MSPICEEVFTMFFNLLLYAFNLSICAVFQNEADFLKEWIEYHRIVGVEHFYLYNNESTDEYLKILQPYINEGVVEVKEWPGVHGQDWTPYQRAAYNDCIQKCKGKSRWLAVIDLDEFIVPVQKKTIQAVLKEFDSKPIGGLVMNWQIFGTSNIYSLDPAKPLIEQLIKKAPVQHGWNNHVKTICKPEKVDEYLVHGARYKKGFYAVTSNRQGGPFQPVQTDKIYVNHYWTKDEKYFIEMKLPRRERVEQRKYTDSELHDFLNDFNRETDTVIHRFLPELKKVMRPGV